MVPALTPLGAQSPQLETEMTVCPAWSIRAPVGHRCSELPAEPVNKAQALRQTPQGRSPWPASLCQPDRVARGLLVPPIVSCGRLEFLPPEPLLAAAAG